MATSALITDNTKNNNHNHINIINNTNIPMSHTHTSPSSPPTIASVVSIAGMLSPLSSPPPPSAKAVMAPHAKEHDLSMWQSAVNAFGLDQPSPEQLIQQQMQAQSRNIILQSMAVQGMGITEALKDYGTVDFSDARLGSLQQPQPQQQPRSQPQLNTFLPRVTRFDPSTTSWEHSNASTTLHEQQTLNSTTDTSQAQEQYHQMHMQHHHHQQQQQHHHHHHHQQQQQQQQYQHQMMLQSQMPIHHHMPTINDEDPFGEYVMMENMPGRLMNDNTMDEQVYGFNIPTSPDVNTFKGPSVPNPVWTLTAALQKPGKAPKAKKTTVRPPRALECFNCKVTQTPLWRRTLDRKHSLCNACGLYYKQYNGHRPLHIRHKPSLSQSQRENASPYTLTPNAQKKDSASSSSVSSPESAKVDDPDTGSDPTEESDTQTAEPTKDSDQEASSETLSFEAKAEVRSEETSKSLSFKEGPRVKRSSSSGNSKSQKMQSRHRQTRSFTGPIHTDSYMGVPIGFAGHLPQGQQDMTYSMASGMAQMIGPMVDDSYRQALYQQHTSGFMVDESHRESPLMGEGGPFSPASSLCSPLTNATVSPLGHGPMAPYTLPPTAMPGLDVSNNPTPTTTAPTINSNSNEQVAQSITPKSLIFDDMRFQVFVENMRPKQMVKFLNVLENRCHVLRNRLGMPALTLQNHQQMNHPSVMTPTTECGFQSLSLSSPVQEGLGYPWPGHQPGFQGNGLYMYANNDEMMMDHQIIGGGRDEGEDTEDESVQFSSGSSTVVGSSGIESKFWHSSATSVGLHATE